MTDRPSDHAMTFEAVKVSFNQDKTGYILRLSIHPNDVPEGIMRDWVGTRYQIAAVKINEQNEPEPSEDLRLGNVAVKMAGMLAGLPEFQSWMYQMKLSASDKPADVLVGLREYLGVKSRSELKTNKKAADRMRNLADAFENHERIKP